jgi:hypothetical protein
VRANDVENVVKIPRPRNTWTTRRLPAIFISSLLSAANAQTAVAHAELSAVFYDFEVASYCGLVTDAVGIGFRRETKRLVSQDAIDSETVTHLRGKAWQAAHAEWQNRGLGGFRNWCRNEGRAAAARLSAPSRGTLP